MPKPAAFKAEDWRKLPVLTDHLKTPKMLHQGCVQMWRIVCVYEWVWFGFQQAASTCFSEKKNVGYIDQMSDMAAGQLRIRLIDKSVCNLLI